MKTVDEIVRAAMTDIGLPIHYYIQLLNYAIDVVSIEISLDSFRTPIRAELTLGTDGEVALPTGFDSLVSVSHNRGNYLVYIPEKSTLKDLDASSVVDTNLIYTPYVGSYYEGFLNSYGEHLGKFFGTSSDNGIYYSIDNGKLIGGFNFAVGTKLYLEYYDDSKFTINTIIATEYVRAVRAFIKWKFLDWNKRTSRFDAAQAKKEYYNELRLATGRTLSLGAEDWLLVFRKGTSMAVKM